MSDSTRQAPYGYDFSVNDMHVDEDAVCPVCLGWIAPHDIVRRTAYGPVQHELCPLRRVPGAQPDHSLGGVHA